MTSFLVEHKDLTSAHGIVDYVSKNLSAIGGGDTPEAVMDGLMSAIGCTHWRPESARYIFHVCDAPPHGK